MRPRFTIDADRWKCACEYAAATNRTPSELVVEALDQIQARYPKKARRNESDVERLAVQVAALLGLQVPAGTFGVKYDSQ